MIEGGDLASILEARGDSMAAVKDLPWMKGLRRVPRNASAPLAMSGPHPRAIGSYGPQCVSWAKAELGITLRWWQRLAITRQLEHDDDGVLVWREIDESASRRVGKSVRLRTTALWRVAHADLFREQQLAMLVSKDLAVGKEIHRGSWRWAEQKGWGVTRLNGAQEIETPTGDRWLLRAPGAAYGYDVGYGQVDESWDVDPMAITDGIEPALLERESPQLHLTSTGHAKATSLMRRRLIAALRDADPNVLLLMWGAHPLADFADERTWRQSSAHWSVARRDLIARKYAAALAGQDEPEFDDPDPMRGWAAQYLNVWPGLLTSKEGSIFPSWDQLAASRKIERPAALGIATDVNRRGYFLGGSTEDGYVDLITPAAFDAPRVPAQSVDLFVSEVARISRQNNAPIGIQVKGPAWHLKTDIEDAGGRVEPVDFDEFVQACGDWERAHDSGVLKHGTSEDLDKTIPIAEWRTVNDRLVITRRRGDISALESVIIARRVALANTYNVLDSIA